MVVDEECSAHGITIKMAVRNTPNTASHSLAARTPVDSFLPREVACNFTQRLAVSKHALFNDTTFRSRGFEIQARNVANGISSPPKKRDIVVSESA